MYVCAPVIFEISVTECHTYTTIVHQHGELFLMSYVMSLVGCNCTCWNDPLTNLQAGLIDSGLFSLYHYVGMKLWRRRSMANPFER